MSKMTNQEYWEAGQAVAKRANELWEVVGFNRLHASDLLTDNDWNRVDETIERLDRTIKRIREAMPERFQPDPDEGKYNGWTNYETWNVKLWLDNDRASHEFWREQAADCYRSASAEKSFTRAENAALALREQLKLEHEDAMPELQGTFADLLNGAMSDVNWYEIAKSLVDDHVEQNAPCEECGLIEGCHTSDCPNEPEVEYE